MTVWIRSSACTYGDCVEAREHDDGGIEVRDSNSPGSGFRVSREDWAAFVVGVKRGDFDQLAGVESRRPRVFLPGDDIPYGVFCTDGETVWENDEPDGMRNGNSFLAYVEVLMPDVDAEVDRARAERGLD